MSNNKLIIITAPSGSGKTTLVKQLLQHCPELEFSISACTRDPRNGEINGRDYYFYDIPKFQKLIAENAFIEWEMVYAGKYYGTLKSELQRAWDNHKMPLVDIDVNGALAIKDKYKDNALTIFIKAPSLKVIRERLLIRGTENMQSIEERIAKATYELTFMHRFQRVIVNDNLETATKELLSVVEHWLG